MTNSENLGQASSETKGTGVREQVLSLEGNHKESNGGKGEGLELKGKLARKSTGVVYSRQANGGHPLGPPDTLKRKKIIKAPTKI